MSQISPQLQDCIANLKRFIRLLQQESQILANRDTDELSLLLQHKNQLSNLLGVQWLQLQQSLGIPSPTPDAIGKAVQALDDKTALAAWHELNRLTTEAQALNKHNGVLIREQLSQTKKAIDVLHAVANQNSTYGPDGAADGSFPFSRSIDKA